jgi:aminopeptidase YwaD
MRAASTIPVVLTALLLGGCTSEPIEPRQPEATTPAPTTTSPTPTPSATPTPPPRFEADRALQTARYLALRIGPRLATSPAFLEASTYVTDRFAQLGYAVEKQTFRVPAGDSWGVPVEAGRSTNIVATSPGFDPGTPYVVVGAHLDTVAVSPGAEDNGSGIGVLLELARVLEARGQVVLVAFGGEEPRGPGELHHFGSKAYVAALTPDEGRNLRGMVSLDRVGAGSVVPISSVEGTPSVLRDRLAAAARELRVPTVVELDSASDHESFADAGFLAARIGSTPYAGYHSAQDLPRYVVPAQLRRVGRILTTWLADWSPRTG